MLRSSRSGLTGKRMILQAHEHEACERLAAELTKELAPQTELERQLAQKLIDCHTRLNRIAAQCRSRIENADSFETLGRYEARISRQLLQYTKELERLQADRIERERIEALHASRYESENEPDTHESGSFRQTPSRTPNGHPPAAPPLTPPHASAKIPPVRH